MTNDIQFHADQIRVNGYTVLEDLLPLSLIEAMREAFDRLLEEHRASNPTNRGANRYQMYLPFEPPFADPLVYENDTILAIVETVFGYPCSPGSMDVVNSICTYFASDTPLPGSEHQRVHSDTRLLFPEEHLSLPCYGLVLNIPLVDVTEENGPMEVWPGGTHLWTGTGDMQELAKQMPSGHLTMNAGSVVLRDLRMWHRGTPNRGTRSRPNVALVYTRPWYRFEQKPPVIPRAAFDRLSERAQKMFRFAVVEESQSPSAAAASAVKVKPRAKLRATLVEPSIPPVEPQAAARKWIGDLLSCDDAVYATMIRRLAEQRQPALERELIAALGSDHSFHGYQRIVNALAYLGGNEAAEALAQEARTQRSLAVTAIHGLAECGHPSAIPTLIELLETGTFDQRYAAGFALSKLRTALAVAPLCSIAADANDTLRLDAARAVREMGKPDELARIVLADPSLSANEVVDALRAMSGALRFDPQRFLDREAAKPRSPLVESRARQAAELYRAQMTLLHPSGRPDDMLLHPITSPSLLKADQLLKPADGAG